MLAPHQNKLLRVCLFALVTCSVLIGGLALAGHSSASPLFVGAAAGIHAGNHINFWNPALLRYIDGRNSAIGGKWPGVIVFLTRQAYNVGRTASPDCRVISTTVGVKPELQNYLQAASAAGVKIILRVYPSPGNFSTSDHSLSLSSTPADGGSMCGAIGNKNREEVFRSYSDIIDEMVAIHDWNADNGITEHGFVPANEPNNPNEG